MDSLFLKALYLFVHMKNDRSSCVKNEKSELVREVLTPGMYFGLYVFESLSENRTKQNIRCSNATKVHMSVNDISE